MKPETSTLSTDELLDHTAWIRALARGLVHDKTAVEDLVQETWLAFLHRRPSEEESIRPWLARVLRNQAALRLRRMRNGESRERDVAPGDELPSALELVERAETQRRLVEAVLELDEPYRGTVLLRYFEGLSAVEIARRRAIPAATVRTHLKRGLDKLREKFDHEAGGDRRAWVGALLPLAGTRAPRPIGVEDVSRGLLRDALRLAAGGLVATAATLIAVTLLVLGDDDGTTLASAGSPGIAARRTAGGTLVGGAAPGARVPAARAPTATGTVAPPSLRLLHEDDGSALADYFVRLHGPQGETIEKTTDGGGRIVFGKGLPTGEWELELIDHPGLRERRYHVHGNEPPTEGPLAPRTAQIQLAAGESTLRVAAGPSYALQVDAPQGVDPSGLHAHLRSGSQALFRIDSQSRMVAPLRTRPGADGTEGADVDWVRFGPLTEHFTKQGTKGTLEVFSQDGLYFGEADVPTIRGAHAAIVAVTVEPRAVLHGSVQDELGPATMLDLTLIRPDGEELLPANPDSAGGYRIPWLEPGKYTVRVDSEWHRPHEVLVQLGGAEDMLLDIVLERLAFGGEIAGRLRSQSALHAGTTLVVLDPTDPTDGRERRFLTPDWSEDNGESVAAFSFGTVPAGEYDVRVLSVRDLFPWTPSTVRVTAPATGIELVCADQDPILDWGVEVFDSDTGEPLTGVVFVCRTPDGQERSFHSVAGAGGRRWALVAEGLIWSRIDATLPARGLPAGAQFEWAAYAPGYAPAFGDQEGFFATDAGRVATVHLTPGWGARIRIVDLGGAPIASSSVEVDGGAVASLTPGVFQLAGVAQPGTLDVLAPGYSFASGPFRPRTKELVGYRVWYEIRLAPP